MTVGEPLLRVEGLDALRGQAHILADVTFSVRRGEVVALLGRNGAGKSTTLKAIIGLLPSASGRILFDGMPIEGAPPHVASRRGVGYVPEDRRIFTELTVLENLTVARQPPRAGAPHWTPDALFRLFPARGELRRRPAGRMSGGEQQMLSIARTLMGNPLLLLLDEPCEGLAPKVVADVADAIGRLKAEGLSVLLAEQNLRFAARVADRVVLIERGRVRYEGSFAGLPRDDAAPPTDPAGA
jgi:branched-chain amino acid transport system ATP-binding protein